MKLRVKHVVFLMCLQMALLLIWRSSTETSGMGQGGVLGRGMMNGLSSGKGTSYVGRWNVGGSKGATPNVHFSSKGVTWFTSSEGFARQLQVSSKRGLHNSACGPTQESLNQLLRRPFPAW